jgi:hypothetical protein
MMMMKLTSNYWGISLLSTSYKILPNILLSRPWVLKLFSWNTTICNLIQYATNNYVRYVNEKHLNCSMLLQLLIFFYFLSFDFFSYYAPVPSYSCFFSIWWIQKIWSVIYLLCWNPHWWPPVISSAYGISRERGSQTVVCQLLFSDARAY